MPPVEMVDKSREPSSLEDIREAITTVEHAVIKHMLSLPPELAVMLGTIHRCLKEYLGLREHIRAKGGPK